ncbi:MAG: hypothetical protein KDC92_03160 [Bacteroidetes bacterium]|nr:hypothetical protein [Bacteroidota bacterium]
MYKELLIISAWIFLILGAILNNMSKGIRLMEKEGCIQPKRKLVHAVPARTLKENAERGPKHLRQAFKKVLDRRRLSFALMILAFFLLLVSGLA